MGPYASSAHAYRRAGWAPLPLPERAKAPVPDGWTGREGAWPSGADIQAWIETHGSGNVGLRMPPTVLGVDVDAYGSKLGAETLAQLSTDVGPLPRTWRSTSREDGQSGIYLFTVPAGRRWPGVLGAGIEVVRHEHRYAVAWPSIHPDTGGTYRWLTPDGIPSVAIPLVSDLPALPTPWLDRFGSELLSEMPSAGLAETQAMAWLGAHGGGQECAVVRQAGERAHRDLSLGSRHEAALLGANRLVWLASEGHTGAARALYALRLAFLTAVQVDRPRDAAQGEWGRLLTGAVNLAAASHPEVGADPCRFGDLVPSVVLASTSVPAPVAQQGPQQPPGAPSPMQASQRDDEQPTPLSGPASAPSPVAVVDPLESAWRQSLAERFPVTDWHALWADESTEEWLHEPLLGRGRSVVIYSPPKVGKSLLVLELVTSLALATPWLGSVPLRPLRVLLLDFENSPRDDIRVRLQAMGYGPDDLGNVALLSFPTMHGLDTERGAQELLLLADIHNPDVVVVDTVSRVISGEENSNDTWLQIYRLVGLPLKSRGVAVIRLDHTGKDEDRGMRGGSAKYGDVDAVWRLSTVVPDRRYRLECTQSRMAMATKVLDIERRTDPLQHVLKGALTLSATDEKIQAGLTYCELEGLPRTATNGDVQKACRAHGGGWDTNIYREITRRWKAGDLGHMSDLERPSQALSADDASQDESDATPEGRIPRSTLTYEEGSQGKSAGPRTLTYMGDPYEVGSPVSPKSADGWYASIAGRQQWVDRATGTTHDAAPE